MVSATEPGEPLIVSGTIYAPDGHTPLEGISLWVYHTDATGHYSQLRRAVATIATRAYMVLCKPTVKVDMSFVR